MDERRSTQTPVDRKKERGLLERYAHQVNSAKKGASLQISDDEK